VRTLEVTNPVDHLDVYGCIMNFRLIVAGEVVGDIQVLDCSELEVPGTRFKILRSLLEQYNSRG